MKDFLNLIIGVDILFAIFMMYTVTQMAAYKIHKKLILIALCSVVIGISLFFFNDVLGYPIHQEPVGDFELIAYRTIHPWNGGKDLQLWVSQKGVTRLYEFKYNPDLDQNLANVEEQQKKGRRMLLNLHPKKRKNGGGKDNDSLSGASDIDIKDITPSETPKDEKPHTVQRLPDTSV